MSTASVTVTRPNDTTPYNAGDVAGATLAAIEFPLLGSPDGGEHIIVSASLRIDKTAVISGETSYRLHLYNVTPPSALADNAVWDLPSGDRAAYLGYIDIGTVADLGSTVYVEANSINKQVKALSGSLFGYLVTVGAYTPAAQTVYALKLSTIPAHNQVN